MSMLGPQRVEGSIRSNPFFIICVIIGLLLGAGIGLLRDNMALYIIVGLGAGAVAGFGLAKITS